MYNLPTSETIVAMDFNLTHHEEDIVSDILMRVYDSIFEMPMFDSITEDEKQHVRHVLLAAVKYYVDHFSRLGGFLFFIPAVANDSDRTFIAATGNISTVINAIYLHIINCVSLNGLFTEYWGPVQFSTIEDVINPLTDVILSLDISPDEMYDDVLDRAFQEHTNEIQEKLYGEHQNHTLSFSTLEPVERNEDNSECQLCCERSDYVCEKCNEPLCVKCIEHLRRSTNVCPACQADPIVLRRICDGEEFKPDQLDQPDKSSSDGSSSSSSVVDVITKLEQ